MSDIIEDKELFLVDSREYIKTGRKAVKKLSSGKIKIMIEIQPRSVYNTTPHRMDFNKWVTEKQLMPIINDPEDKIKEK